MRPMRAGARGNGPNAGVGAVVPCSLVFAVPVLLACAGGTLTQVAYSGEKHAYTSLLGEKRVRTTALFARGRGHVR